MIITGFEKLSRQLQEAQKALREIDGIIGTVSFDPTNPQSIEAAMQHVDMLVDERLAQYSSNPIIGPLAKQTKEHFRQAILERAATLRLSGGQG